MRERGLGFLRLPFRHLAPALVLRENGYVRACMENSLVHAHNNFNVTVHEAGTNDHTYS